MPAVRWPLSGCAMPFTTATCAASSFAMKPSNILVDGNGRPKLIDFGVARTTDSDLTLTS